MNVVKEDSTSVIRPVGLLASGSTVINGEGNICIVARCTDKPGKVRLVNLDNGGTYYVNESCRHEEVIATVTWRHKNEKDYVHMACKP